MSTNNKSKDHSIMNIGQKCKKCIFRVPNVLWRQNPAAYTPDVVSIGPFHHYPENPGMDEGKGGKDDEGKGGKDDEGKGGKDEGKGGKEGNGEKYFQLMGRVKKSYLNEILAGMQNITLEELSAKVIELSDQGNEGEFEQRARNFYAEPLDFSSEKFIKMMIVDGCFLIQLFRKCNDEKLRAFDDPVFNMDCMFHFLCHDILLLENQLPWFVIHSLYSLIIEIYPNQHSLSFLVLKAFSILPSLKQSCSSYNDHLRRINCLCDADYLHILDLVRKSIVGTKAAGKDEGNNEVVHEAIIDPDLHQIRTATELSKSDIKFKMAKKESNQSIMDIRFKKGGWFRNGILEIPQLNVGMSSETLFRNLIAIEQCYHDYSNEITSYAIFMDNLISSKEDMELLCKKKVIGNLMSDEDGGKFFSNLYKDIPHNKFYYVELCKEVNARYNLTWYTWLALLKFEKFSNPWKVLAFVVAIIALTLTAWSQTNLIRINWHK